MGPQDDRNTCQNGVSSCPASSALCHVILTRSVAACVKSAGRARSTVDHGVAGLEKYNLFQGPRHPEADIDSICVVWPRVLTVVRSHC